MAEAPEKPHFTPFDRLTDDELREAMVRHIRMGYILKNPGKSKEANTVAKELVSRLSLDQLKEVHKHTFFANSAIGTAPKNPYEEALKILDRE